MKQGFCVGLMALVLSACALTPEQQLAREHQRKLFEQNLQISLAAQCDAATAEIMKQHFQQPLHWGEDEKKAFELKYIAKVSEPMFQACYKMAWQNHVSQQRLRQMHDWYEWQARWHRLPYYYGW